MALRTNDFMAAGRLLVPFTSYLADNTLLRADIVVVNPFAFFIACEGRFVQELINSTQGNAVIQIPIVAVILSAVCFTDLCIVVKGSICRAGFAGKKGLVVHRFVWGT